MGSRFHGEAMRLIALVFLVLSSLSAVSAETDPRSALAEPPAYPLWDGNESVSEYAKRAKLSPTKSIDLGNGVILELTLIPAGRFTMGTPTLIRLSEEDAIDTEIWIGRTVLVASVSVLLVLATIAIVLARRRKQRLQISLAQLVIVTIVLGVGLLGGLHWWHMNRALESAKIDHAVAMERGSDAMESETPAHNVTISSPFYLGLYEITLRQFEKVMGIDPMRPPGNRDLPAGTVSWHAVKEFCKRASETTGLTMRLPSEAEWEYACRAGTKTKYYSGDDVMGLHLVAWFSKNSKHKPHPGGGKQPNAWGVYDMHGNVYEWCEDEFEPDYTGAPSDGRAWVLQPDRKRWHVVRGGSCFDDSRQVRCASRFRGHPESGDPNVGFRVVVSTLRPIEMLDAADAQPAGR